mmetsp:Transcript_17599/g.43248  ORF Transcript_17599/g.43248 Transcript_17599/m.43248 type:complete len:348 (-) Transcript_17599:164-1207(-)
MLEQSQRSVWRLTLLITLLFASFLAYGVIQERIMTKSYAADGEEPVFFRTSAFLVLVNRLVTMLVAMVLAYRAGETLSPMAPIYLYAGPALSNFLSTLCQYEALKAISFPTQTLAKCGKVIPVLVLGTLGIGVKKYGQREYFEGLAVTLGCVVFMFGGDTKAPQTQRDDSVFGIMLMLGYLFFDGFVAVTQERVFRNYDATKSNMMIYMNASSAVLSVLALVGTGQLWDAVDFVTAYPALLGDAFFLSMCAMLGQQVIYRIISEFGALVFAMAMTTRQFVAILLSCFLYVHPLSPQQWLGTAIVFSFLYYKATAKKKSGGGKSASSSSGAPVAGVGGGAGVSVTVKA